MLRQESISLAGGDAGKRVLQPRSKRWLGACRWGRRSDLPSTDFRVKELGEKVFFFFLAGSLKHRSLKEKGPNIQWSAPATGTSSSDLPTPAVPLGTLSVPSPEAAPLHPTPLRGHCRQQQGLREERFCIHGHKRILLPYFFSQVPFSAKWCRR